MLAGLTGPQVAGLCTAIATAQWSSGVLVSLLVLGVVCLWYSMGYVIVGLLLAIAGAALHAALHAACAAA